MSQRHDTLVEQDKRYLWHPFTPQQRWIQSNPLVIERGEGNYLIDDQGQRYLDAVSSLWTNVHGHNHPYLNQALQRQINQLAHSTLLGLTHPTAIELAKELVQRTPKRLSRVFYSDSGSTATEIAVKMAFQAQQQLGDTHKTGFATLKDAYHGDTIGAVSVGGIDIFHEIFRPLLFPSVALAAPTQPGGTEEEDCLAQALKQLEEHAHHLAGFIFEPLVQGAAGMKMHSPRFINTLAKRARELGILLIADEVAVGFGRTGTLFACEHLDFEPDFLCLAKGISGGYLPLAATLASEAVYEAFLGLPNEGKQFFHGHTYTGNPLACAVSLASLEVFDKDDVLTHVNEISAQLTTLLTDLKQEPWVLAIRQNGLMVGIDLCQPNGEDAHGQTGHQVSMAARPLGAILRPLGNTIVLNPPLSIRPEETDTLVRIVRQAAASILGSHLDH